MLNFKNKTGILILLTGSLIGHKKTEIKNFMKHLEVSISRTDLFSSTD